jgi:hypothetical protein
MLIKIKNFFIKYIWNKIKVFVLFIYFELLGYGAIKILYSSNKKELLSWIKGNTKGAYIVTRDRIISSKKFTEYKQVEYILLKKQDCVLFLLKFG